MRLLACLLLLLAPSLSHAATADELYAQGVEAFQEGDLKRAMTRFAQLVLETDSEAPIHRQTTYNLARTLQKLKQHCSAVDRFDRYLELVDEAGEGQDKRVARAREARMDSARLCASALHLDARPNETPPPDVGLDPFWNVIDHWLTASMSGGLLVDADRGEVADLRARLGLGYGYMLAPRWGLNVALLTTPAEGDERGFGRAHFLRGRGLYQLSGHVGLGAGLEVLIEDGSTALDLALQLRAPLWRGWALCVEPAVSASLHSAPITSIELRSGLRYGF